MTEAITIASILGLSLGSFVNTCAYRIPRGLSIIGTRSFCPQCQIKLKWFNLIPVVSFFVQRSRCSACGAKIPVSYPLIELLTDAGTVALLLIYGLSLKLLEMGFMFVLMLIVALIDWKRLIIPNSAIAAGFLGGIVFQLLGDPADLIGSAISSVVAFLVLFVIRSVSDVAFKKPTMGMGDVKLFTLIAFLLGLQYSFVVLWAASLTGVLVWSFCAVWGIRSTQAKLPFGTFLAAQTVLVVLFQQQINELIESWLTFSL